MYLTPLSVRECTGRITALCSMSLSTKCAPGRASPFIAIFSAWVQLRVNTVFSGSAPKNSAQALRLAKTARDAAIDIACPDRPGLAP